MSEKLIDTIDWVHDKLGKLLGGWDTREDKTNKLIVSDIHKATCAETNPRLANAIREFWSEREDEIL